MNNCLHIKLTNFLKSMFIFLLRESDQLNEDLFDDSMNNSLFDDSEDKEDTGPVLAMRILKKSLKFMSEELVDEYLMMSKKESSHVLYMGFLMQLFRLINLCEKRGHKGLKGNSSWEDICSNYFTI